MRNLLHNTTIPKYQDTKSMSIQRNGEVHYNPTFLPDKVRRSLARIEHWETYTEAGMDLRVLQRILQSKIKTHTKKKSPNTPSLADSFDPQIISLKHNKNFTETADYNCFLMCVANFFPKKYIKDLMQGLKNGDGLEPELTINLDIFSRSELKSTLAQMVPYLKFL